MPCHNLGNEHTQQKHHTTHRQYINTHSHNKIHTLIYTHINICSIQTYMEWPYFPSFLKIRIFVWLNYAADVLTLIIGCLHKSTKLEQIFNMNLIKTHRWLLRTLFKTNKHASIWPELHNVSAVPHLTHASEGTIWCAGAVNSWVGVHGSHCTNC